MSRSPGKKTSSTASRTAKSGSRARVAAAAPARKTAAKSDTAPKQTRGRPVNDPTYVAVSVPAAELPHWTDTLSDGTHVIVRPIRKQDAELERAFIKRLSPKSRRMRFLGQIGEPSDDLIRRLTDIDYVTDMAFIALVHRDGQTREIGVSRYSASADGKFSECAVTVSDEWHNKGLATLLMRHLIEVARAHGIRKMVSYDAADNVEMRRLAAFLGFSRLADPADPGMVVHSLLL